MQVRNMQRDTSDPCLSSHDTDKVALVERIDRVLLLPLSERNGCFALTALYSIQTTSNNPVYFSPVSASIEELVTVCLPLRYKKRKLWKLQR